MMCHFLGSQAAGYVGKTVQNLAHSKTGRITGLDPAAPLFEGIIFSDYNRLTKEDAELVVIHTDGSVFGYANHAGDIDFFPNSGTYLQPGCFIEDAIRMSK